MASRAPKGLTLASYLPTQLKPPEQSVEVAQTASGPPRPQRCRCEGPFDLCWRYPHTTPNAVCKPTWDKLLAPFHYKGREWTIVELRSLWPHTIQALNERLTKGRMERTLKEDLQDDLQVLVDLIQYSCKPHPRPPRAGMKTLIVQGRILAEAIAQDALFQLDPADPSAPRPDRDLIDLINRLREHHPNSLLAPALHVLRTLGNTAVHLDRDSARLTDAEIGDAAAICCRCVVAVVDAYMHMCANLHRHEETQDALAQPLVEVPAAPIPAPNVLLRPREAAAAGAAGAAFAEETSAAAGIVAAAAAAPPPPRPQALLLLQQQQQQQEPDRLTEEFRELNARGARSRRGSTSGGSGGGGNRSRRGSADGVARLPYTLAPPLPSAVAPTANGLGSGGGGDASLAGQLLGSRRWWPPLAAGESAALAAVPSPQPSTPPLPLNLLRRSQTGEREQEAPSSQAPQPNLLPPAVLPSAASAVSSSSWLLEGYPVAPPPPLPSAGLWAAVEPPAGAFASHAAAAAVNGANNGGTAAPQRHFQQSSPSSSFSFSTDPWDRGTMQSTSFTAATAASATVACGTANGYDFTATAAATAAAASASSPSMPGSSLPPHHLSLNPRASASAPVLLPHSLGLPAHQPPNLALLQPQRQQLLQQQPQPQASAPLDLPDATGDASGSSSSGGGGVGTVMNAAEASKRLLQLCAAQRPPPAARVLQLLQAGASLAAVEKSGMTALHMACYWGHTEAARLLLQRLPGGSAAAAAAADREGRTPLWVAAQRGHCELVELLLLLLAGGHAAGGGGGEKTVVDAANTSGVTPLRVAAAQGHTAVVAALLRAGAQAGAADKDGFTPLYVACARSHLEVVQLLLAAGAPADTSDKAQRTPLWAALHPGGTAKTEACPERRAAVVRALLGAGADVHLLQDARDRDFCWQLLAHSIAGGE